MKAFSFLPIALLVLLLNIPNTASSQVLIPDTVMRSWLNSVIPGIVDANGVLDTLNPAIASVDSMGLGFILDPLIPMYVLNLEGIQYMDSLQTLHITTDGSTNLVIECGSLPASVKKLVCYSLFEEGTITMNFPQLPASMDFISIDGGGIGSKEQGLNRPGPFREAVENVQPRNQLSTPSVKWTACASGAPGPLGVPDN